MDYKKKIYTSYLRSHLIPRKGIDFYNLDQGTKKSFKQRFSKHITGFKDKKVVDLGSGSGHLLRWLQTDFDFKDLTGIEINSDLTKNYPKEIKYQNLDIIQFLEKGEKFDLFILKDVLEHFTKEEAYYILELIYGSLNTGGRLVIQVPNAESPLFGRVLFSDFTHEQSFTATGLSQVFNSINYKNNKCYSYFPAVYSFTSLIRYFLFRFISLFYYLLILSETSIKNRFVTLNIIVVANK